MASTSKSEMDESKEPQEVELEHFDDFTLASSWERFISEIEAVCRQWLADGTKSLLVKDAVKSAFSNNLYKIKCELKYDMKTYCLEYHFEGSSDGKLMDWDCTLHDVQLSFGVRDFLVIAPQSASGVVLDAQVASKLLSAVAIALTNCCSLWPAFVPVHDPSRHAYIGIQNMGTAFTRRFEANYIGNQVPIKLMHLEGLHELFVSKFAFFTLDLSTHLCKVHFTMKLTYRTLPSDDDDVQGTDAEVTEKGGDIEGESHSKAQWDDDCPWSEWYSAEDPVKGFELISIWLEKIIESSLEMAELENSSPYDAERWIISPSLPDGTRGTTVGFASQLRSLVDALHMSFRAQFIEDFVSGAENVKSSAVLPSPTVLDRVLKDLFYDDAQLPDFAKGECKRSQAIKGAPPESIFGQFCLHSLWFGNCSIRAIAVLWIEFVREVRWCWEETQPLPKMLTDGVIDLGTCLIHQKLHMLAICIEKKRHLNEDFHDNFKSEAHAYANIKEDGHVGRDIYEVLRNREDINGRCDSHVLPDNGRTSGTNSSRLIANQEDAMFSDSQPSDYMRRGSSGVLKSMMLLNSYQNMHVPFTQDATLMTEDMHEERLQAVEAVGNSFSFSAQLEKDVLSSDMSAFKAANPNAIFEDFIRWHTPGDWVSDDIENNELPATMKKDNWPPRGQLSQRMSESGNLWRKIWNEVPALPVSEQRPLLDPNREGEKILHYLETLRPHQLLEQMVCTAFRASADTLSHTSFGALKHMDAEIGQLYLTMQSVLRPLQANHLSNGTDSVEDLRRLCDVFERVEELLRVAASLCRKLVRAPRLLEAIFNDYYNFYLPKMGTGSGIHPEFGMKQEVRYHERQVVANMFTPPTANQSWRKVISMGNLLNGHEPISREIIFSTREGVRGSHYASSTPPGCREEIETYRMYIRGTSNDLRVALSVVSCD